MRHRRLRPSTLTAVDEYLGLLLIIAAFGGVLNFLAALAHLAR